MKLKLIEKKDEAKGTKSFFWRPEKPVSWKAGQYFYFTLAEMKYPDPRGNTRHFTISSSPTEGEVIKLTTRIRERSGYKKALDELSIGAEIDGEGPNGNFFLENNTNTPNLFIAGGIGITPFRAMIKNAIDKSSQTPFYLIYSNSVPEEIAFATELKDWAEKYPNIKVEMTVSSPQESKQKWGGRTGRIDDNMIRHILENWHLEIDKCTFWVSGPPAMADAMEEVLGKMGVTSDKLRVEKFTGY